MSVTSSVLSTSPFDSADSWTPSVLHQTSNEDQKQLDVPRKPFTTTIRHALTGMKASSFKCGTYLHTCWQDGPGLVDIMRVLGKDRTLERLK